MGTLRDLSKDLAEATAAGGVSVVRVEGRRRMAASGVVLSGDGLVVTAHHVLERDEEIQVGLAGGAKSAAKVLGRDPSTDLALLKLETGKPSAAPWSEASAARVGEIVLALGRPGDEVMATLGVVSALEGSWRSPMGGSVDRYLQSDVVMYPGFSGGALLTAEGKVIGVNTSGLLRGVSVALPTETVRRVAETLAKHGKIRRGYLGVGVQAVRIPDAQAKKVGQETGLMVLTLEPESPASKAGVLIGDVLLALGEDALADLDGLMAALSPERVNQDLTARLMRGGESHTVKVRIGERA
ncbi:MAG: S1C family serine protease [Anaerolineales bacterium]